MGPAAPAGAPDAPETLTLHADAVLIGEQVLVIRGASGAGKSTIARRLVAKEEAGGGFARLVADDRVRLTRHGDALLARPHPAIAGLLEIRGVGLVSLPHEPAGRVGGVLDLADEDTQRLPQDEDRQTDLMGLLIPRLAIRHDLADADVVLRWFRDLVC